MKIAAAQIRSSAGEWEANTNKHIMFIEQAAACRAGLIVFPELSLTGYEPGLAKALERSPEDSIFDPLSKAAAVNNLTVCAGAPLRGNLLPRIGMLVFYPDGRRQSYSKQILHEDEIPHFEPGREQVVIEMSSQRLAPAICYESMQPEHIKNAMTLQPSVYLSSVSKTVAGMQQAHTYFSRVSAMHSLHVCLVNAVGRNDNFDAGGMSSFWNKDGNLLGKLGHEEEILMATLP